MNSNFPLFAITPNIDRRHFWLALLALLLYGNAWGGDCVPPHDMDFDNCVISPPPPPPEDVCTYAVTSTTTDVYETIIVTNPPDTAVASFGNPQNDCDGTSSNFICLGLNLVTSSPPPWTEANPTVTISGDVNPTAATETEGSFNLLVTDGSSSCERTYKIHITGSGGGWGDPHITTVDGKKYDFQSAGEFIALRGNGLEIQTRQTAVSTKNPSGKNAYTGIASCVSIYTAVAASVGTHRVTIQPNLSGVPDPSGLQIRVDGALRTLGPEGIDLSSCNCQSDSNATHSSGRIVRSADDESIEIHYASGTKLVVTPAWWQTQEKWYLNINVYDTTASEGIMGRIAKGSWLPALSDGNTVGPKEGNLHKRYVQLYETFADSWRVIEDTSLFDYAQDTSTEFFTLDEWPRENPENCLIDGEPEAVAMDESLAIEHCREIIDENNKANCIFDVKATGHTGFADAYARAEQIVPGATQTSLVQSTNQSKPGTKVTFTAKVKRAVSTIGKVTSGRVQFVLNDKAVENPKTLDANGNAMWSTASLPIGSHNVEARYFPSGFGERFRPSSSKVIHEVSKGGQGKWWLSFHAGLTAPTGDFGDDYDESYSVLLDLEYEITPTYSFLGLLGYNHFEDTRTGIDDTDWTNLSANAKYYFYRFADLGEVWVNAGVGAYMPESGSTRAGANVGIGVGGDISPQWRWELGVNYHNIFTSGGDTQFVTPQLGVAYKF